MGEGEAATARRLDLPKGAERRRESPRGRATLVCELLGIGPSQGNWYRERYAIEFAKDVVDLGVIDWADWDHSGDLLIARDGRLLRLGRKDLRAPERAKEIADLRPLKFEARESPPAARVW